MDAALCKSVCGLPGKQTPCRPEESSCDLILDAALGCHHARAKKIMHSGLRRRGGGGA